METCIQNTHRTEKRQLNGSTHYTYDGLNQLTKVQYPTYTEELYYDKTGNRTKRTAKGIEELYKYDPRNRLTEYTKGGIKTEFLYDNAGNLLRDDKAKYTYDAFNRTEKVETFDGHVQINRYDAEGLRHELEEDGKLVQFIFRGDEIVGEEKDSNIIRYIRGYDLVASDAESARTYYHYASDEMGSITHVVEEDQIRNHYEYDAWGNATTCEEIVENRFRFNGQQYDPITQQYYLRARFYNPVIGRFTQEDTYRGDGLNLYAYCSNSPLLYRDLNGLEKEIVWGTDDKGRTTYTDSTGKYTKDGMGRWHAKNGKIVHDPTKSSQSKNIKPQNQITGDTVADRYKRIRAANPNISASEALELARNGVDGQVSINLPPVDNDNHHGTRKRENGQYHVFYTHHLDPTKRFSSDSVQFRDANKALQKELQENYAFRKKMFTRYPGLIEWSKRGDMGVRLKEAGLVWHHDPNSFRDNGTFDLQLCDWNDHNSNPNIYNDENGHGGRNNWGGGIPGRDGKLDVNGNLIQ